MLYKIEHRVQTLSRNAVMEHKESPASFTIQGITFSHWDFNEIDGWQQDFWLAEGKTDASTGLNAINQFRKKLEVIIPRIALIGQCFIEFTFEPWLVRKRESDIILYRLIKDRKGVGLMFQENEKRALEILLENKEIPEEFYYYWNDAVNSIGYPAKLLLMFSAVESLAKDLNKKKNWEKIDRILGEELTLDLFGTKEEPESGLRHRLVHGEYFNPGDAGKDYINLIHKKVLSYFNKNVIKEDILELGIVRPQRHFFGNKEGGFIFMRTKLGLNINLKDILTSINKDIPRSTDAYELIFDKEIKEQF